MAVIPLRRRGGRVKRLRYGPNVHAQSAGNWYKHTDATPEPEKSYQIDELKSSSDSPRFHAGGSGNFLGSDTSRASQQGKNSARIPKIIYQEDELPAASQDLKSSEILAYAIVRGFKMRAAKKLPQFLQRRASSRDATTGNHVEIRESQINGNALIIAVRAVDLPKITRINGALYAGTRLAIRPYLLKNSIPGSHVGSAKGAGVSQAETSGLIPNADYPQLASDESAGKFQPADITLLASHFLESPRPEADMILPGLNFLAAVAASNKPLQQDPKLYAMEETTDISTSKTTETKEEEIVIKLSETAGISLSISHLCLSQSEWDLELALEAVNFAAEFASTNDLELQASILCLDYKLWDMDSAALFVRTVGQEVSDKTGMTIDWAMECLASNGWTVKRAVKAFEDVKDRLPYEACKKE